jgi:hypothetical protein
MWAVVRNSAPEFRNMAPADWTRFVSECIALVVDAIGSALCNRKQAHMIGKAENVKMAIEFDGNFYCMTFEAKYKLVLDPASVKYGSGEPTVQSVDLIGAVLNGIHDDADDIPNGYEMDELNSVDTDADSSFESNEGEQDDDEEFLDD